MDTLVFLEKYPSARLCRMCKTIPKQELENLKNKIIQSEFKKVWDDDMDELIEDEFTYTWLDMWDTLLTQCKLDKYLDCNEFEPILNKFFDDFSSRTGESAEQPTESAKPTESANDGGYKRRRKSSKRKTKKRRRKGRKTRRHRRR